MKKVIVLGCAIALAFCASALDLVEDPNGSIRKVVDGVEYRFTDISSILGENVSIPSDASWWFTPESYSEEPVVVTVKNASGGVVGTVDAKIGDSVAAIQSKILNLFPDETAKNAYRISVAALAQALKASIDAQMLKEQIQTIGRSLQADMFADMDNVYQDYTADDGTSFRLFNSVKEATDISTAVSQLKQFRNSFSADGKGSGSVTVSKGSGSQEGKVGLSGGGSGGGNPDQITITTNAVGQSTSLHLVGFFGGNEMTTSSNPESGYTCDHQLADLLGSDDSEIRDSASKHWVLAKINDSDVGVHWIPLASKLSASASPDRRSVVLDDYSQEEGAGNTNLVALYGFKEADKGKVPQIDITGSGNDSFKHLTWVDLPTEDNMSINKAERNGTNCLQIAGFKEADNGKVPSKVKGNGGEPDTIAWIDAAGNPPDNVALELNWKEGDEHLETNKVIRLKSFSDENALKTELDLSDIVDMTREKGQDEPTYQMLVREIAKGDGTKENPKYKLKYMPMEHEIVTTSSWNTVIGISNYVNSVTNINNFSYRGSRTYFKPTPQQQGNTHPNPVTEVIIDATQFFDCTSMVTNENLLAEIAGFKDAADNTSPVKKSVAETGKKYLAWEVVGGQPDSEVIHDIQTTANNYRSLESVDGYGELSKTNVWQIYGFDKAPSGSIPRVRKDSSGSKEIQWGGSTGSFSCFVDETGSGGYEMEIREGYYCKARTFNMVQSVTVSQSGFIYLKVPLGSGTASIVADGSTHSSDSNDTYVPLYYFNATTGAFSDYRGAPHIQVWE